MTVALHIREDIFVSFGSNFNYNLAVHLAKLNPDDHYILFYDSDMAASDLPANCTVVRSGPLIKNQLSEYYWYNYKAPSLLRRYGVELFVPQAGSFCFRCNTGQIYLQHEKTNSKSRFLRSTLKAIAKANAVIHTLPLNNGNSAHFEIPFGLPAFFKPLDFTERAIIKEKYTSEDEYFFAILNNSEETFRTLLKSFSHFKKWQRSSLKLVVVVKENMLKDFHLYKYRNDVVIFYERELTPELKATLMGAAYCNIVSGFPGLIASVKCQVPSINISSVHFDSKATLSSGLDEKNISKNMILVYKDEQLRNEMIKEAVNLSGKYTWENAAAVADALFASVQ